MFLFNNSKYSCMTVILENEKWVTCELKRSIINKKKYVSVFKTFKPLTPTFTFLLRIYTQLFTKIDFDT